MAAPIQSRPADPNKSRLDSFEESQTYLQWMNIRAWISAYVRNAKGQPPKEHLSSVCPGMTIASLAKCFPFPCANPETDSAEQLATWLGIEAKNIKEARDVMREKPLSGLLTFMKLYNDALGERNKNSADYNARIAGGLAGTVFAMNLQNFTYISRDIESLPAMVVKSFSNIMTKDAKTENMKLFLAEVYSQRVLASLKGPVIRCYGFCEHGQRYAFYERGLADLSHFCFDKSKLSPAPKPYDDLNLVLGYARQVLKIATFLKTENLVHKDIKPQNILVFQSDKNASFPTLLDSDTLDNLWKDNKLVLKLGDLTVAPTNSDGDIDTTKFDYSVTGFSTPWGSDGEKTPGAVADVRATALVICCLLAPHYTFSERRGENNVLLVDNAKKPVIVETVERVLKTEYQPKYSILDSEIEELCLWLWSCIANGAEQNKARLGKFPPNTPRLLQKREIAALDNNKARGPDYDTIKKLDLTSIRTCELYNFATGKLDAFEIPQSSYVSYDDFISLCALEKDQIKILHMDSGMALEALAESAEFQGNLTRVFDKYYPANPLPGSLIPTPFVLIDLKTNVDIFSEAPARPSDVCAYLKFFYLTRDLALSDDDPEEEGEKKGSGAASAKEILSSCKEFLAQCQIAFNSLNTKVQVALRLESSPALGEIEAVNGALADFLTCKFWNERSRDDFQARIETKKRYLVESLDNCYQLEPRKQWDGIASLMNDLMEVENNMFNNV